MRSASILVAGLLAGLSATAQASHYAAGFHLDGWLPPLRTNTAADGPHSLPGEWSSPGSGGTGFATTVRTRTLDGTAVDPVTGAVTHTYSPYMSAPSVHVYQGHPLSLGESIATLWSGMSPDAFGHSHLYMSYMSTELTGVDGRLDGQSRASWSRGFSLDPYSSFTIAGTFDLAIEDTAVPLSTVGAAEVMADHSFASLSYRDTWGRVGGYLNAVIGGAGGPLQGGIFDYDIGEDGRLSLTITNPGAGRLYGTLFAGTQANVVAAIPEPGTWALMLLGVGGVATASRRGRSGRNAGPLMPA
ncbi:PEP-CTERM sorting domain-containing protein [Rhizobacter sp. LjRoot28]|jgi:hypothetical protein|uniref:PEP-CTERM sorting domain-containing protein n=1 Tax=Rhizobacter sp. LjRoot28 TaxID=3342309 RepID=UPI003ECD1EEA